LVILRLPSPVPSEIQGVPTYPDRWAQRGIVYLWRYRTGTGNYPGWHLTAEDAACLSLDELLQRLCGSPRGRPVTISTTKPTPTVLAIPNHGTNIRSVPKLMLDFDPARPPDHWHLATADGELTLELGLGSVNDLAKGLSDIRAGQGDYCIGSRRQKLWFWWHPRAG
jgi:hypothetical protein